MPDRRRESLIPISMSLSTAWTDANAPMCELLIQVMVRISALVVVVVTLRSVSTWMGDRIWAGKSSRYVASHLAVASKGNEYCGGELEVRRAEPSGVLGEGWYCGSTYPPATGTFGGVL